MLKVTFKMKKIFSTKWGIIVTLILLIVTAGGVGYAVYLKSQPTDDLTKIKEAVGRHLILPSDETPALLTVVDAGKLSSEFLKVKAKNDDRILIYQKNQRVIIYRPSVDRVVDVGPVIIDDVKVND